MCIRKLLSLICHQPDPTPEPPPEPQEGPRLIALLFAINNYPSGTDDLNGCLNDQRDIISLLTVTYGMDKFELRAFRDREVTRLRMITEISAAIADLGPEDTLLVHYSGHGTQVYDTDGDEGDGYDEALWLWDSDRNGPLTDDDLSLCLRKIQRGKVVLAFDSCYSGTVTRGVMMGVTQNRFHPVLPIRHTAARRLTQLRAESKQAGIGWLAFAGCGEEQTCADAYFNGRANGAFTYYWLHAFSPELTYGAWYKQTRVLLPNKNFEQIPEVDDRGGLLDKTVFK